MDDIGKIRQRPLTELLKFPNILPLYGKAARIVKKKQIRTIVLRNYWIEGRKRKNRW